MSSDIPQSTGQKEKVEIICDIFYNFLFIFCQIFFVPSTVLYVCPVCSFVCLFNLQFCLFVQSTVLFVCPVYSFVCLSRLQFCYLSRLQFCLFVPSTVLCVCPVYSFVCPVYQVMVLIMQK